MKRKLGLAVLVFIALLLTAAAVVGALSPGSRIIMHEPSVAQPATDQPTGKR